MPILTGKARVAGVLGWPVAHTRSPRLHGYWLERYGVDGAYVPLPVRPERFDSAVRSLCDLGFAGANVTVPHKQAAYRLCDELTPGARRSGAVNTLVFRDGRIHGSNTDGSGFLTSLGEAAIPLAGPALLLGAGGGARAIAAALLESGVDTHIAARRPAQAAALAAELGAGTLPWEQRETALGNYRLLVNTSSAGMQGQPALAMRLDRAADLAVVDIVYVPLRTPLLEAAEAAGLRTLGGLGMLLHQAGEGFRHWFGVTPVVDAALRDFVIAGLT